MLRSLLSVPIRILLFRAALLVFIGAGTLSSARAAGIACDLDRRIQATPTNNAQTRIIVQFARRGEDADRLARAHWGRSIANHPLINGATLTLPLCAIRRLSNHPNVAWISPDRAVVA